MADKKILSLVGGISKDSLNKKLFRAAKEFTPAGFSLEAFDISQLPFFSQDLEKDLPEQVKNLKEQITESAGILFITPEYNRSFPAVLKNAIDWGSRPWGKNSWDKKPAGIIGASVGNIGTFGAQNHLRQVLAYLNMPMVGQPEFYLNASQAFDKEGNLVDEKTKGFIKKYWQAFANLVDKSL